MADAFEKLAEELSADQKLEYFSTLREIGITTKSDMTLAKLLQALQLYKAYYESIPAAVDKAAANMVQIKTEIVKLARQTEQSANAGEASLHQLMNNAAEMNELLKRIHSHIEEAADKASEIVSNRMTELLTGAMEKALPLSDLKEAGTTFFDAIKNSEYASAELRNNVKYVRRARFRTLAVAFVFTFVFGILGTAGFFYFRSEQRIAEARAYYFHLVEGNNNIVSELAESRRSLILQKNEDGTKLLIMENAEGRTNKNNGMIKFK